MATIDVSDWTELASRENDGLAVTLLWDLASNQVKLTVADSKLDDEFELEIAAADALAAFYHPFAFAARRRLRVGPLCESAALQAQS
jgi:hypothetical protein